MNVINSLVERLYATEAHARIIDKDEAQPLTVLLRDVRRYLEAAASTLGTDQADTGEQGDTFAASDASPALSPVDFYQFRAAISTIPVVVAMESLYRTARALSNNIAEFGTVTDGEFVEALDKALDAFSDHPPQEDR